MTIVDESQQAWVPYEARDCSQGFCSVYCPQWCYIIFPPPPPFILSDDDGDGSGTAFSPLVIAIIGILASAFLLVSYYTIVSKYCGTLGPLRRWLHRRSAGSDGDADEEPGQSHRLETEWHVSPTSGLEDALISKITVYRYKKDEGLVDGTDCSVCLGEFREDESLRLLPKCSHAFHLQCIDTWLKSHSNCPLCRANIVSTAAIPQPLQLPAPPPPPLPEPESNNEMAIVIEDPDGVGEQESNFENDGDLYKHPSDALCDSGDTIQIRGGDDDADVGGGVHPIRRSFSMDLGRQCRISIADVLRTSMEDEFLMAKDRELLVGSGSWRRCGGEQRSRGLHCVMSPVPMKRSVSSGRFCFTRNGRGSNGVLPIRGNHTLLDTNTNCSTPRREILGRGERE